MKRLLSFPPISFTLEAFSTYGRCGVAQAAAALSYFLISPTCSHPWECR